MAANEAGLLTLLAEPALPLVANALCTRPPSRAMHIAYRADFGVLRLMTGLPNGKIETMSITIQPELEAKLRARAEIEGLTVESYIERIALDDQEAEEELETLALEAVNSGQSIDGSQAYWEEKRRRLIARYEGRDR